MHLYVVLADGWHVLQVDASEVKCFRAMLRFTNLSLRVRSEIWSVATTRPRVRLEK